MEGADASNHSKTNFRRSSNNHISMSDTESMTSQVDSWHSPLRSDDPSFRPENNDKAIVFVDKYNSPAPSPGKSTAPSTPPASGTKPWRRWPHSEKPASDNLDSPAEKPQPENPEIPAAAVVEVSKFVREEPAAAVKKVGPVGGDGAVEEGYGGVGVAAAGGERESRAAVASILKRSERSVAVRRLSLAFRIFEVIACLISFSVMAADKTEGWSGDSFDRYMVYRYCLAVNVIGFAYSGFQAFDLAYYLGKGKHIFVHHLRRHFDFAMDQILAYLLMSASSSAATRVDDWISNWGADEFTMMASASVAMSFLAFLALAVSSLVSGYILCDLDSD